MNKYLSSVKRGERIATGQWNAMSNKIYPKAITDEFMETWYFLCFSLRRIVFGKLGNLLASTFPSGAIGGKGLFMVLAFALCFLCLSRAPHQSFKSRKITVSFMNDNIKCFMIHTGSTTLLKKLELTVCNKLIFPSLKYEKFKYSSYKSIFDKWRTCHFFPLFPTFFVSFCMKCCSSHAWLVFKVTGVNISGPVYPESFRRVGRALCACSCLGLIWGFQNMNWFRRLLDSKCLLRSLLLHCLSLTVFWNRYSGFLPTWIKPLFI